MARHRASTYWGRPVPGFGDPDARLLLVGLAPAAHGGNRTGRVFTGDDPGGSGELLFEALYRAGYSPRPRSVSAGDGLSLRGAYIAAVNRCAPPANRPTVEERDHCLPYLGRELRLLTGIRVIVALGGYAWEALLRQLATEGHRVHPQAALRSWQRGARRTVRPAGLLSPQPAEHLHRPPDGGDARRHPVARSPACRWRVMHPLPRRSRCRMPTCQPGRPRPVRV